MQQRRLGRQATADIILPRASGVVALGPLPPAVCGLNLSKISFSRCGLTSLVLSSSVCAMRSPSHASPHGQFVFPAAGHFSHTAQFTVWRFQRPTPAPHWNRPMGDWESQGHASRGPCPAAAPRERRSAPGHHHYYVRYPRAELSRERREWSSALHGPAHMGVTSISVRFLLSTCFAQTPLAILPGVAHPSVARAAVVQTVQDPELCLGTKLEPTAEAPEPD